MIGRTDTSGTLTEHFRIKAGGNVLIGTDTGSEKLCIKRDDAIGPTITIENNANKTYINNWGATGGGSGRTNRFEINATLASQASYCAPYHTFMIGGVGDSNEKVRIDSAGRLMIGTTTEGFATYGDKFTIDDSGHCGMTIRSGTSNYGTIYFSDGDDGSAAEVRGFIDYNHSNNNLQLGSDGATRLRIHSTGTVQALNQLTSRNGIVQVNQVTSTTRYSGSPSSVDLITGSTFTPKTSDPRFLIMIFCPVNTSDDSDAGGGNTNFYF